MALILVDFLIQNE